MVSGWAAVKQFCAEIPSRVAYIRGIFFLIGIESMLVIDLVKPIDLKDLNGLQMKIFIYVFNLRTKGFRNVNKAGLTRILQVSITTFVQ